jgi:hypothetical protein
MGGHGTLGCEPIRIEDITEAGDSTNKLLVGEYGVLSRYEAASGAVRNAPQKPCMPVLEGISGVAAREVAEMSAPPPPKSADR